MPDHPPSALVVPPYAAAGPSVPSLVHLPRCSAPPDHPPSALVVPPVAAAGPSGSATHALVQGAPASCLRTILSRGIHAPVRSAASSRPAAARRTIAGRSRHPCLRRFSAGILPAAGVVPATRWIGLHAAAGFPPSPRLATYGRPPLPGTAAWTTASMPSRVFAGILPAGPLPCPPLRVASCHRRRSLAGVRARLPAGSHQCGSSVAGIHARSGRRHPAVAVGGFTADGPVDRPSRSAGRIPTAVQRGGHRARGAAASMPPGLSPLASKQRYRAASLD